MNDPRVQALFEKMADRYDGNVQLERWFKDGSARIRIKSHLGDEVFRVRWYPHMTFVPIVSVTHRGLTFHVSPIPSVVIAAVMR